MNLHEHVILGGCAALPLVPTVGVDAAAAFWGASVLLDVDHYWDYLVKTGFRDWGWRNTFALHRELSRHIHRPDLLAISVLHTVEWLLLVSLAAWWWGGAVAIAAVGGMLFHLTLDLVRLGSIGRLTVRALSLVEYVVRRRRLVRRGYDPDAVYREALAAIGVRMPSPVTVPLRRGSRDEPAGAVAPGPERLPSFTVVVPALNEEDNLRATVEAVLKEFAPHASTLEVLVFDDASTDRTGAIADELSAEDDRVRAAHNEARLNIGGIYKAGLARARGEFYVLVPGDNETRVDEIARGLAHVGQADLVVFHVTNPRVRGLTRRLLSRAYVMVVNLLFGTGFRYTNGTNVFRTDVLRRLPIRTNGFSYQTEAVVKAVRSGVDFVPVGIEIQTRDAGTSKAVTWKNFRNVAAALGRLWWDVVVRHRPDYRRRGRALRVSA